MSGVLRLPDRRADELAASLRRELRDLHRETPRAINARFFLELRLRRIAREQGLSDAEVGL